MKSNTMKTCATTFKKKKHSLEDFLLQLYDGITLPIKVIINLTQLIRTSELNSMLDILHINVSIYNNYNY